MSDQETRDRGHSRRAFKKKGPKARRKAGPTPAARRQDPWCDDYTGDRTPGGDEDRKPLDFND